jgi:hypothetical protein
MTGSWDSNYPSQYNELRTKYRPKFAWFSTSGHDYVVTDVGVLEELHQAMAPQNEVNRMHDAVNQHQSNLNRSNSVQEAASYKGFLREGIDSRSRVSI